MTENERYLTAQIMRLEADKEILLKKLQREEEINFQRFEENMRLSRQIKELERVSKFYY